MMHVEIKYQSGKRYLGVSVHQTDLRAVLPSCLYPVAAWFCHEL